MSAPSQDLHSRHGRRPVFLAFVLFVVITVARLVVANPIEAVGFLYVVPISVLASERGWRGGVLGAAAATLLTVFWAVAQEVPLGVFGYGSRMATFFVVGVITGIQAEYRNTLERERAALVARLHGLATQDQLTGLPNRRAWDERLSLELARASRSGAPLSVAAIDVDGLKRVNDTQGHERGDLLLRGCAAAWTHSIREVDFLARLGGDEFFVLLPDCSTSQAEVVARRMLERTPPGHLFSVGIATWEPGETTTALASRADAALYEAKRAGGSQVRIAEAREVATG